jgi:hypothetical protein
MYCGNCLRLIATSVGYDSKEKIRTVESVDQILIDIGRDKMVPIYLHAAGNYCSYCGNKIVDHVTGGMYRVGSAAFVMNNEPKPIVINEGNDRIPERRHNGLPREVDLLEELSELMHEASHEGCQCCDLEDELDDSQFDRCSMDEDDDEEEDSCELSIDMSVDEYLEYVDFKRERYKKVLQDSPTITKKYRKELLRKFDERYGV